MFDSLSKTMSRNGLMATFSPSAPSMTSSPRLFTSSTKSMASSTTNSSTLSRGGMGGGGVILNNTTTSTSGSSNGNGSSGKTFQARVVFLDDSSHIFEVDKKAKGAALLEMVYNHLELNEREYFGLIFSDLGGAIPPSGQSPEVMRWLDQNKLIRKQTRNSTHKGSPVTLYFRVKFYVTDPSQLKEEFTRYHVYLQVKKDLLEGRLSAPPSTLCLLTSFVVQSSVGDYDPDAKGSYLSRFNDLKKLCLNHEQKQNDKNSSNASLNTFIDSMEEVDRRVMELHKLHKGQSPADAELNFLEHAKRLEMYGISLHNGKDSNGRDIQLGVTCVGLVVFQNHLRINTFSWSKIVKISFKRKQFFIQLRKELTENYDTLLGFNLTSYRSCKNLWKSAVEHHSFFRLHSPKAAMAAGAAAMMPSTAPAPTAPKRFLMTLGSRFRYSSRTDPSHRQQQQQQQQQQRQQQPRRSSPFSRSPSKKFLRQTLPLNLEVSGPGKGVARLASPETSSIGSSVHSNGGGLKPVKPSAPPLSLPQLKTASSATSGGGGASFTGSGSSLAHRAIESFNNKVQSLSTKLPRKAWQDDLVSDDEGGFLDPQQRKVNSLGRLSKSSSSTTTSTSIIKAPTSSLTPSIIVPSLRLAYADESSVSTSVSDRGSTAAAEPVSVASSSTITNGSSNATGSGSGNGTASDQTSVRTSRRKSIENNDDNLVIINIIPDEAGRFGFNVKGGADQKMPIIVSRVGPNTPADKCYPKLNEGDQVVLINGRDVSGHTHDQVVNFIRACSEPHSRQLVLAVKQNVYIGEDVEEPEFQYVPETPHISPQIPGTQALSQSMLLLEESLESGAIIGQFEQLYRRNTNLMISECHKPENLSKNRYRDISPYDISRVVIKKCPSGDYINANHVVMTIPGSGIINRYIATQGPLTSTCSDFWHMVWEVESSLIIMLTTIVERGRVKCHKYWPDLGQTMEFQGLRVTCTKEVEHKNFAFRDFTITRNDDEEDEEEEEEKNSSSDHHHPVRSITQMAYNSWPDHGVPDSSDEFVDFVETVRTHRQASICPTVVHCSAGIGRTGVLILMETALYLIEANQPVYPLDLTRTMRDQRASMIQTPSQYKFVCQAILKVYKEGKVKPLPEFCVQK